MDLCGYFNNLFSVYFSIIENSFQDAIIRGDAYIETIYFKDYSRSTSLYEIHSIDIATDRKTRIIDSMHVATYRGFAYYKNVVFYADIITLMVNLIGSNEPISILQEPP